MRDFFKFEDKNVDVPFYNRVPELSKFQWILLVICEILFIIPILIATPLSDELFSLYTCLVVLIPILYVSRNKLTLFFKKIKRKDIKLIILCTVLSLVYSVAMIAFLEHVGISSPETIISMPTELTTVLMLIVQLMGEELFKIILLIIVMFLVYNLTKNRKLAITIGAIAVMIAFGSLHFPYGPLIQVLLVQGLGSIFDLYAYLKTKNILVCYLAHILYDFVPLIMDFIG